MQESVLLGKLRHLKHTLEICCQNSNASTFSGYSWTLARDYVTKVSDEVDQQLITWQDLDTGVRTATLVSAQMKQACQADLHYLRLVHHRGQVRLRGGTPRYGMSEEA